MPRKVKKKTGRKTQTTRAVEREARTAQRYENVRLITTDRADELIAGLVEPVRPPRLRPVPTRTPASPNLGDAA